MGLSEWWVNANVRSTDIMSERHVWLSYKRRRISVKNLTRLLCTSVGSFHLIYLFRTTVKAFKVLVAPCVWGVLGAVGHQVSYVVVDVFCFAS